MATHNPLAQLPDVEIADLRQLPCILVASGEQQVELEDIIMANNLLSFSAFVTAIITPADKYPTE